ncbi:MAG: hypothetical protein J3K34DRAFT_365128, partial [Monoraphidium minutum]
MSDGLESAGAAAAAPLSAAKRRRTLVVISSSDEEGGGGASPVAAAPASVRIVGSGTPHRTKASAGLRRIAAPCGSGFEEGDTTEEPPSSEVAGTVAAEDDTPCAKCGASDQGELMLLCDACDAGWHTFCLDPPLAAVPEGDWACPDCEAKRAAAAA